MLRTLIVFIFLLSIQTNYAQQLYKPRDIQQAFKKGTRSEDGKPGKNYWQNYGRYNIQITATPPNRTIRGVEEITYINHSPDTLQNLVFKLILNIHKPGAIRLNFVPPGYLTSGMHIDSFMVNNVMNAWKEDDNSNTVMVCHLEIGRASCRERV